MTDRNVWPQTILIFLLALCVLAFGPLSTHALALDQVFVNGKIFTANPDQPFVEAIAVRDEKVLAVGSLSDVRAAASPDAEQIDLGGQMLLPGLIDTHTHAVFGGATLQSANLDDQVLSEQDLARFVEDAQHKQGVGSARRGDVLYVAGANDAYWSQLEMLDRLFSTGKFSAVPVVLAGSDFHTGWANAAMRKRAGIDRASIARLSEEQRGGFGVGPDGEPDGFGIDAAWDRIASNVPPITGRGNRRLLLVGGDDEQLMTAGRAAVAYNNSYGITAWLDPAANVLPNGKLYGVTASVDQQGLLPVYRSLSQSGELTAHVAAFILVNSKAEPEDLATVQQIRAQYQGIDNLTLPGIKVFGDGVIEYPGQTAALSIPYRNSGKSGFTLFDPEGFKKLVTAADQQGLIVHVHAIGDVTVRGALDAFEAARTTNGNSGLPHSITHLQIVAKPDIPRFKELDVVASMQLSWALTDLYAVDLLQPYIDPNLYQQQYPARSLYEAGATIAGASDWPISTPSPFEAIYEAVTRKGPKGVLNAAERLPRLPMLYAYTRNAARALHAEDRIGTLAPGYQADMVLIDRDLLSVDEEAIQSTRVVWTMFGGRIVYRDGDVAR